MKNEDKTLVGKPEGKRVLRRPKRGWENNIKMNLKEIGCEDMENSRGSGQGPQAGSCEHSNEPSGSIKGREFIG
jgi:hypothetical protein